MTVDHPIAPWGYGTGATLAGQQLARRIGRNKPVERTTGTAAIRPYVIPWSVSADNWGVSFPAGLVGVVTNIALSGSGSYNARLEAAWNAGSGGLVLVPGVLPAAYTPRLVREWHSASQSLARIRTASGYSTVAWMPSTAPLGTLFQWVYFSGPTTYVSDGGINFYSHNWSNLLGLNVATIGWRKVQFRAVVSGRGGPGGPAPNDYTFTVTVSHNADGSDGVNYSSPYTGSADGAIVDSATTFLSSDISNLIGTDTYATGWFDCATAPAAAVGTLTHHIIHFEDTGSDLNASGIKPNYIEWRLSPNLDVPYPFTATGQGDLIAPGGLVT